MNKQEIKKPSVRFNNFIEDWKKIKIINFSNKTFGGATPKTSNENYWDGEIPWIQSSDLIKDKISNIVIKKKITKEGLEKSATKLVPRNSIAIVTRVGVGKVALMPFEYTTSQDFLSLSDLKVDKWFGTYSLYYKINQELNSVQGTSIKGITKKELLDRKTYIPGNIKEQSKIGGFFKQLDGIITLQQQLLDDHKQLKKAMMQKMFPRNEKVLPRIRFDKFTDNWNKISLSSVLKERNIKQVPEKDSPLVSFSVEKGVTPKTKRYERDFLVRASNKKYKLTKYNDIVYNPANLKFGAISRNAFGTAVFSPIYITFETQYNPEFIELIVTNPNFINRALKYQEGTVYERKAVKPKDFLTIFISLPSKEEQKAIVNIFRELDSKINIYQNKLETYQELKKAMLQKMFV